MNISYRRLSEYIPVDIARLRPKDSYASLIKSRTHAIDGLIARHGQIPEDLLIVRACPTCASPRFRDELRKDHMTVVRCEVCDLVYVNPAFDEKHYRSVYSSEEYQEIMKDLGIDSHDYRVERFGTERVSIMARYVDVPDDATVAYLDVGCSTGFVVEAAAVRGWRGIGIDLNPSAVEFGLQRGLDLRHTALEDEAFDPESFHAVSLFDVLEHLLHPQATLDAAVRLIKPGGILFLYVPNYDSASRLFLGADAHFIWPTHHLNYYTPSTLTDLMRRSGLDVVMMTTEGLDISDYLWYQREVVGQDVSSIEVLADTLQFLVNAGCYGKNLRLIARKPVDTTP